MKEYFGDSLETELLDRLSSGEEQAFRALYDMYWEELYVSARKVLRSELDAADIVQEVFLSLWRRRTELNMNSVNLTRELLMQR